MLQKEAVDKTVLDLLFALQEKDYLKDFFLVGGTGLALMIGHRKSSDIDLFTVANDGTRVKDFMDQGTNRGFLLIYLGLSGRVQSSGSVGLAGL